MIKARTYDFRLALFALATVAALARVQAQTPPGGDYQSVVIERPIARSDSRARLEMTMLSEARLMAVEKASGLAVRQVESMATSERNVRTNNDAPHISWYQDYLYLSRQESAGRIVEEHSPRFEAFEVGGVPHLRLNYGAKVVTETESTDPGFEATLRTRHPSYRQGDTLRIEVQSSRDAQLYLFNMMPDGRCTLIWPNTVEPQNKLRGQAPQWLPMATHRYAYVAELPAHHRPGDGEVQELLFGIFFKGPEPLFQYDEAFKRTFTIDEINRLLLKVPRSMRTEAMAIYGVVE